MKKTIIPIVIGLLVIIALTIASWSYYTHMIQKITMDDVMSDESYQYHYVFITHSSNDSFWKAAYQSAKTAAQQEDAYVELIQVDDSDEYTLEDYLRISIAAKVDGIIIEPNGEIAVSKLIDEAHECVPEIPVITVLEDASQSMRKSFVGVNSYQLGHQYGKAILSLIDHEPKKVMVFLNGAAESVSKDIIFAQIKKTITEQLGEGQPIEIDYILLNGKTAFDSEERIRNLFVNMDSTPDILVCLNEVDTVSAYQSLVDFNKVGEVSIIGYYPSDSIIGAISKGTIPVVFELDASQVGQYSVDALIEYRKMGHVSAYFSVDLNIVTKENVDEYIQENKLD